MALSIFEFPFYKIIYRNSHFESFLSKKKPSPKCRGVYSGHSPPWRGGGKRHFLEFGEENRPLAKKISEFK
jgi:hypothetical protein